MRSRHRGYTLVEIMAALAIVGIVAVLALYGIRRWIHWARTGEDKNLVQMISYGQYAYYQDTAGYLNCSDDWNDFYPAAPDNRKRPFHKPVHADYGCWHLLGADSDSPTYAAFVVRAGTSAEQAPSPPTQKVFTWPSAPYDKPWFVVLGVFDKNGDGVRGYMLTSSFMGTDIHMENEDE